MLEAENDKSSLVKMCKKREEKAGWQRARDEWVEGGWGRRGGGGEGGWWRKRVSFQIRTGAEGDVGSYQEERVCIQYFYKYEFSL